MKYFLQKSAQGCIDWIYEQDSFGKWRLGFFNQNGWARCKPNIATDPRDFVSSNTTELTKEEVFIMVL